jgi:hypothetical protein
MHGTAATRDATPGYGARPLCFPAGFTRDPVTAYRAVLMINALLSALVFPLGFVAGRRMGLERRIAFWVAMVAAVLPAGLFYAEYAIYP